MIISKIRMKSACKLSDWGFLQPTKSFPVRTDKLPTGAGGLSASTTLYFVNLFFKVHPPIGLEKFRVLSPRQPMFALLLIFPFLHFTFLCFSFSRLTLAVVGWWWLLKSFQFRQCLLPTLLIGCGIINIIIIFITIVTIIVIITIIIIFIFIMFASHFANRGVATSTVAGEGSQS